MSFKKPILNFLVISVLVLTGYAQESKYQADFESFWQTIGDNYAYFDKKQTDWKKVKEIYSKEAGEIKSHSEFVRFLELVFRELYDNHSQLNTNRPDSSRLVPSGTDIWAEWQNDRAIITSLRRGFGAEKSGLKVGMEISSFNNTPISEAIQPFIGKSLKIVDLQAKNWALNNLLAGNHQTKRVIETKRAGKTIVFQLDEPKMQLEDISYDTNLDFKKLDKNLGYIKINNSLGQYDLIKSFDHALSQLFDTKGMILDLRETASGGDSTIARAIMSRFINSEMTFQKHSIPSEKKIWGVERSWFEIVSPRGKIYERPLIVLVNRWTGSMGEGIAIGFDAMKRAKIIGTEMAGLNGGMETFTLPKTNIRYSFPTEKIFHVNGQPREMFVPKVLVKPDISNTDKILMTGIRELNKKK